jgi:hypothetical protein
VLPDEGRVAASLNARTENTVSHDMPENETTTSNNTNKTRRETEGKDLAPNVQNLAVPSITPNAE